MCFSRAEVFTDSQHQCVNKIPPQYSLKLNKDSSKIISEGKCMCKNDNAIVD